MGVDAIATMPIASNINEQILKAQQLRIRTDLHIAASIHQGNNDGEGNAPRPEDLEPGLMESNETCYEMDNNEVEKFVVREKRPVHVLQCENGLRTATMDCGFFSIKGSRHRSNEDRTILHVDDDVSIFAVIDGHGGSRAAEYVKRNLVEIIKLSLVRQTETNDTVAKALGAAIVELDNRFCTWAKTLKDSSGACFVAAVFSEGQMYVINLGDCRAFWCNHLHQSIHHACPGPTSKAKHVQKTGGETKRVAYQALSNDHKCNCPNEVRRIERVGGFVRAGRLAGILEPSRSIGDIDLKGDCMPGWLIAEPEIIVENAQNERTLVLATDGLWDEFTTEMAAEHVFSSKFSGAGIARSLCQTAYHRGSNDDITAIAVKFK